jgi:hypothetical protein
MLTLEEARKESRCRICGQVIHAGPGAPVGWKEDFNERVFPLPKLTLKFGKEFAHTSCLESLELQS